MFCAPVKVTNDGRRISGVWSIYMFFSNQCPNNVQHVLIEIVHRRKRIEKLQQMRYYAYNVNNVSQKGNEGDILNNLIMYSSDVPCSNNREDWSWRKSLFRRWKKTSRKVHKTRDELIQERILSQYKIQDMPRKTNLRKYLFVSCILLHVLRKTKNTWQKI